MKQFVIAIALLGSTSLVRADYKVVSADNSSLSQLCAAVAATDSREALLELTDAAGITRHELSAILCNGIPLTRFSLKYGNAGTRAMAATTTATDYVLHKSDSSPLTELCAAAIVSEQEYNKVLQTHFNKDESVESEVLCNGMSLKSFVRKYGEADGRQVSQR